MIGLIRRYSGGEAIDLPRRSSVKVLSAAERKSKRIDRRITFPTSGGRGTAATRRLKRRVLDIQNLSETLLISRAIRVIRGGISFLDYGIQPIREDIPAEQLDQYSEAIQIFDDVLQHPSLEEEDFGAWVGKMVESLLMYDAAVWEYVLQPGNIERNPYLALEPVPGYTIARNVAWTGDPDVPRWFQVVGGTTIPFLHSELEYVMQRGRADKPFGLSQVETVVEVMEAWLGLSAYSKDVASSAYPAFLLYLGEVGDDEIEAFRTYWNMDVKGRSDPAPFGNVSGKPETLQLKAISDEGLYPRYEDKLRSLVALAFDLRPMDLGIERDVNRSTAEVSREGSIEEARRPIAQMIADRINNRVRPKIAEAAGNDLVNEVEFFWIGVNPKDAAEQAKVTSVYLEGDVLKIDEVRAMQDLPPLPNGVGQLTITPYREFMKIDLGNALLPEKEIRETEEAIASLAAGGVLRWERRPAGGRPGYPFLIRSGGRTYRG